MDKLFKVSTLFTSKNGDTDIKKEHINGKGHPVVSSGQENAGIIGFSDIKARIIPANTITVDMFGNVYYRDFEYKIVTHARAFVLLPNGFLLNEKTGLYLTASLSWLSNVFSYDNMCSYNKIMDMNVSLPVIESPDPDHEYTVDDIDWQYMQDRIAELEQDRIAELDAYLKATGLEDYTLTEEDKEVLSLSSEAVSDEGDALETDRRNGKIRFGKFKIGDVFEIYSPKKRFNANAVIFDGIYPYVARGSSNNGIRGYITEDEQYLSPAKSLSFGQDTATIFYQPNAYFTGDKIKVMILKNRDLNNELAQYFITVISKAFSTFTWGQSSFNEKILKAVKINLPITPDGDIDFDYMECYIRAIEKLTIADVVKYRDRELYAAKQAVC